MILKIRRAKMLDRLIKCYNGEVEMTPQQVQIGLKLIGKVLPDLKATEHSGTITHKDVTELTDAEIAARIAQLVGGDPAQAGGSTKSTEVH